MIQIKSKNRLPSSLIKKYGSTLVAYILPQVCMVIHYLTLWEYSLPLGSYDNIILPIGLNLPYCIFKLLPSEDNQCHKSRKNIIPFIIGLTIILPFSVLQDSSEIYYFHVIFSTLLFFVPIIIVYIIPNRDSKKEKGRGLAITPIDLCR